MKTLLSTNELARALCVKPDTIRRSYCVQGHYMGLSPRKLPNARLVWPEEDVRRLLDQK